MDIWFERYKIEELNVMSVPSNSDCLNYVIAVIAINSYQGG